MADDIDYLALARATAGASGAELANIINEGALRAVKNATYYCRTSRFGRIYRNSYCRIPTQGAVISPAEKKVIAYHEIGHALVGCDAKEQCSCT